MLRTDAPVHKARFRRTAMPSWRHPRLFAHVQELSLVKCHNRCRKCCKRRAAVLWNLGLVAQIFAALRLIIQTRGCRQEVSTENLKNLLGVLAGSPKTVGHSSKSMQTRVRLVLCTAQPRDATSSTRWHASRSALVSLASFRRRLDCSNTSVIPQLQCLWAVPTKSQFGLS